MNDDFQIDDKVEIYLDVKFGEKEGWYSGKVIQIEPYSRHRRFYWVELSVDAQTILGTQRISVFNPKNIRKWMEE